jgi:Leu/Phe-tRNA-protein transferase
MRQIYLISPDDLTPSFLQTHLYPDLTHAAFWSPSWDPGFYIALAEAGFISISTERPNRGPILLTELQEEYAVLDWRNLHTSRHLGKLIRSGRLEEERIELRIAKDPKPVIRRLLDHHDEETWLTEPYVELLGRLPTDGAPGFTLHGIELWSRKRNLLIAGELGYTIGRTYTSLSGFHTPDTPKSRAWRHFGTLQMWMLANRLRDRGFAFWNMGHTCQAYKQALGAKILPRAKFLHRWLKAQGSRTSSALRPL